MQLNENQFSPAYLIIALHTAIAVFFFVFNPQGLNFPYGNGNGKFLDRADSYSDYIVRNTIKRNVLIEEDSSFFPIFTKGYKNNDYNFYVDNYIKYTSNLSLQTVPATIIAKALNFNTEKKLDMFFGLLRLAHALTFSLLLCTFLFYFCKSQQLKHHFLIPFLVGGSTGFVFFSQNLYFVSSLILMPAVLIAYQLCNYNRFSKVIVFMLGFVFFLRGYEFATIFAILTGFSAALFASGNWQNKAKLFAVAFGIICLSFVAALFCHIVLVAADTNWALSIADSAKQAFSTVQMRTSSFKNVGAPFSPDFLFRIQQRWSMVAFSIIQTGFQISQLGVILLMAFILVLRLKTMSNIESMIFTYSVAGYLSWYVFAYQHIMWHVMYDWYIFALTVGLAFSLLMIIYLNAGIELILKFFKQGFKHV